ncbi:MULTISPECIES: thioesterase family protein [unclassified Limnobacter]|jgi:acyl-CoA thioester hydrolase|uniref:acyl-CoA thioesterase n=1 Tax=unclassified Limnobacter TaxID=2630203 RepID=UPI000156CC72|nr:MULTISPECIES: thioesterase family protein [unclassified Limnobacter]EDM83991.1 thioesterase family protein domain protein [Limnobacter sp. MED105]MAZ08828.1 acyl-CoA thioesterase [Sutterellaceae bacterium]|tara:strand:+ start:3765 stop:4181 length:417 start_codon:yes stop_codon:yes gene_type:complete
MTTLANYPLHQTVQTRWHDNDIYGHVNNVVYYSYFDSVVNRYLIEEGGLDIHNGEVVGFVVESQCKYLKPLAYPEPVTAGLRVGKLGNSSVRYELGLFNAAGELCAEGYFIHVFVNKASNTPTPIPEGIRSKLTLLVV